MNAESYGKEGKIMKKGKVEKVCGVKIYRKFEKKTQEERGVMRRPAIFRSKKEYNRQKYKSLAE